tara:strand:- start:353 stop:502 length:150 start_codon:yes stop_codon:yes gene_type:complete
VVLAWFIQAVSGEASRTDSLIKPQGSRPKDRKAKAIAKKTDAWKMRFLG